MFQAHSPPQAHNSGLERWPAWDYLPWEMRTITHPQYTKLRIWRDLLGPNLHAEQNVSLALVDATSLNVYIDSMWITPLLSLRIASL
jgi:hypothetical protein